MQTLNNMTFTFEVHMLIPILKENRKKHIEIYELAVKEYRRMCLEQLATRIKDIESGETDLDEYTAFDLDVPVRYTHVYDTIIGMLELTEDKTLKLNSRQYTAWITDKWDWSNNFTNNSVFYASNAG